MKSTLQTVMEWYPNKALYRRTSAQSGKPLVSVYPDSWHGPVISHEEWFNQTRVSPSLQYRPNIPFFVQLRELQSIAPLVALLSSRQENAEYCHDCEGLKDCYMVFDSLNCRDVLYSARIYDSTDCVDAYWVMKSEIIFESAYLFSCYDCRYCFQAHECSDSAFLFDCRNCQHCFMCSGLRNKSYCIRNKKCSREEYDDVMRSIAFDDLSKLRALKSEYRALLTNAVWPPAFVENVESSTGNYLKNCKDCADVFESFDLRDCSNSFQCAMGRDIHNSFMCNDRVELCTNCVATGIQSYNTRACAFTWHSNNMEFCYLCLDCSECFGCWGLKNQKFCILNRPYPEADYRRIVGALRSELERMEFFPDELNPFHFEDTIAADFFQSVDVDLFEAELRAAERAQEFAHDSESATRICILSKRPFKIVEQERSFYSKHQLAYPVVAPQIRYRQRIQLMGTSFTAARQSGEKTSVANYFKHPFPKQTLSFEAYLQALFT